MKKIIALVMLGAMSLPAMAQHYHGFHHRHYHNHARLEHVLGGVALGVILYDIHNRNTAPPPVVIQQPQVIVTRPPQYCGPWTETQHPDGTITRTRTCNQ